MKLKKTILKALLIMMVLCACADEKTDPEESEIAMTDEEPVNKEKELAMPKIDAAIALNGSKGFQKKDTGIAEPFFFMSGERCTGTDPATGLNWGISEFAYNGEKVYLLKAYSVPMAQLWEKYEILELDPETDGQRLLMEKPNIHLLNEFNACGKYLYWVEYCDRVDESEETYVVYRIMQYDLETQQEKLLGERDGRKYDEICLTVDDNYVTWYDSLWEGETTEGMHSILVYDVQKQQFVAMPKSMKVRKHSGYVRLPVCDQGITFFSENDEGELIVRRMQLDTGELTDLKIEADQTKRNPVSCFSTKEYVGYLTEYGTGNCYAYELKSSKLYSIKARDISKKYFAGDKLYACPTDEKEAVCYDLGNASVYVYNLGEYVGYKFVKGAEDVPLLEIRDPKSNGIGIVRILFE